MPSFRVADVPVEINSYCVWSGFRFPISFREVDEMMLERGPW